MKPIYLIWFAILLALDTTAQVAFKLAATNTAPAELEAGWFLKVAAEGWIYVAVAGHVGAFVTYMAILRYVHVGPAFAATHLEIITVAVVSHLLLGEQLSSIQIAGGLLIVLGVFVLATEKDGKLETSGSEPESA